MTALIPPMPIVQALPSVGTKLLVSIFIVAALLTWWALSAERKRGPILPLIMLGTSVSAIILESVFDNTLLYWWPTDNPLTLFHSYGREIPWSVVIGYAWLFGGAAYFLWRKFERGITMGQAATYFLILVFIDWLAISIAQWTNQSAFYGNQPFQLLGSPLWFSFADATGGFALGAAMYGLIPHLTGPRKLLLLLFPTFIYGGVLGATTAPVAQALNSGWSSPVVWLCGAATIALCCILTYVLARILVAVTPNRCMAEGDKSATTNGMKG